MKEFKVKSFHHILYHPHKIISIVISGSPSQTFRIFLLAQPFNERCAASLHIAESRINTFILQFAFTSCICKQMLDLCTDPCPYRLK